MYLCQNTQEFFKMADVENEDNYRRTIPWSVSLVSGQKLSATLLFSILGPNVNTKISYLTRCGQKCRLVFLQVTRYGLE